MRATCAACDAPQAVDWEAGQLCTSCGGAVRPETRCVWCLVWTPLQRFCRSCGTEAFEPSQLGIARMLKDAGVDRFSIGDRLRALPVDQAAHLDRMYQRQAVVAARHVDELRFVESFLYTRGHAAQLDEELTAQLPWRDDRLASFSTPPTQALDDLGRLRELSTSSALWSTQRLAEVARLRLGEVELRNTVQGYVADDPIGHEAALVLSDWRILSRFGRPRDRDSLVYVLERSPATLVAETHRALLLEDAKALPADAIGHEDADLAFIAAWLLGDVDRLTVALGDPQMREMAATRLATLGAEASLVSIVEGDETALQTAVLRVLVRRTGAALGLQRSLFGLLPRTGSEALRRAAVTLLCRELSPDWVPAILAHAGKDPEVVRLLLSEKANLSPDVVTEILREQVEAGRFSARQYGVEDAAKRGAIEDTFVPRVFAGASDEVRLELLRVAERQLDERGDDALHVFVLQTVFGDFPAATRAAACWVLRRWYRTLGEHRGSLHLKLERESVERFFGSVDAFLPRLAAVVSDPASMKEVGLYDSLADLFECATPEIADARLVHAVLAALDGGYWPQLVDAMVKFLGIVGGDARWRDAVIARLRQLPKGGYTRDRALRVLELSVHGLPHDNDWPTLPETLVGERFASANPATRAVLLQVAEAQLIHHAHERLARDLVTIALGTRELRERVAQIVDERAPRDQRPTDFAVLTRYLDSHDKALETLTALASDELGPRMATWLTRWLGTLDRATLGRGPIADALLAALLKSDEPALKAAAGKLSPSPETSPVPVPSPTPSLTAQPSPPPAVDYAAKQQETQRLATELRTAVVTIMMGAGEPAEKTQRVTQLQTEFQEKVRALYAV